MKTILVLANNDMGLYNFRKEVLQKLISEGYVVYISLPDGERVRDLEAMGCIFLPTSVDRRGMNPIRDLKLLFEYLHMIRKIQPDVVLSYTIKPNLYGGLVASFCKIPYFSTITGVGTTFQNNGWMRKFITLFHKIALKKAECVFFENQGNLQLFLDSKIVKENQACLLSGAGVNLEEYALCEYPYETEKTVFLFVGRIMKEKGVDELFEVAERLNKEGYCSEFHLVGFYEEDYQERIAQLEQKGIVCYFGYQKDVKPSIRQAHCFVLPSYHEGMANTLLENGAMGRPLITTDIFGCKEAVLDGENGYLCEVKSADSLYLTLKRFLELSYEEKRRMGEKSREHIARNFDKVKVVETILQNVQKVIGKAEKKIEK